MHHDGEQTDSRVQALLTAREIRFDPVSGAPSLITCPVYLPERRMVTFP